MLSTPTRATAQLVTWHLTDSALPTGGFAHSAGLETFIQSDEVCDAESFARWLHGYLRQASYNEALAVRLAAELAAECAPAAGDAAPQTGVEPQAGAGPGADAEPQAGAASASVTDAVDRLRQLDQLLHACQTARQVRASMNSMGKRWSRIAAIVAPDAPLVAAYKQALDSGQMHGNPGIAAGLVLAAEGVPAAEAVSAYLMQMANSMTQNAIRAIPLGQDTGQRVLVSAYPAVMEAAEATMRRTVADLGVVAPLLEIAQFQHEALRSRMFMS